MQRRCNKALEPERRRLSRGRSSHHGSPFQVESPSIQFIPLFIEIGCSPWIPSINYMLHLNGIIRITVHLNILADLVKFNSVSPNIYIQAETNPKRPSTRPQPGSKGIVASAIFLNSASNLSRQRRRPRTLNPGLPGNRDYRWLCRLSRKVAGEIVEAMRSSTF